MRVAQGISAGVYEPVLDARLDVQPDARSGVRPDVRRLPPCTAAGITGGAR